MKQARSTRSMASTARVLRSREAVCSLATSAGCESALQVQAIVRRRARLQRRDGQVAKADANWRRTRRYMLQNWEQFVAARRFVADI